MISRRALLKLTACGPLAMAFPPGAAVAAAQDQDQWGASQGYPTGWGPAGQAESWDAYTEYRVGNYSGGLERMLTFGRIQAADKPSPLISVPKKVSYSWKGARLSTDDYLDKWAITGLIIARKGEVWSEDYRLGRTAADRLTSWSMAKSVTSLLLGIAIDQGLVKSLDDLAQDYVPSLKGTVHGQTKIRYLINMISGIDVVYDRDTVRINDAGIRGRENARARDTDAEQLVRNWQGITHEPGKHFSYSELSALTIGMVLRAVSHMSLAEFAQVNLWQPMGAQSDATWLTDSLGKEYNCIGFAACLRDWSRLGQLIAQQGQMQGRQVISRGWIDDYYAFGPQDARVRFGLVEDGEGYKNFYWHPRPNGAWLMMNGKHGQRVLVDRATQTVLVQTAVLDGSDWKKELFALFEAAVAN
jgi:CubicO group peptidase (beta-lactamase class C family)